MTKPLNIGLIGFGNIGVGVVNLLNQHARLLEQRVQRPLRIARIADLDIETKRDCEYDPSILTTDTDSVLADPDIDVVIELIGGYEPARTIVETALKNKKHVVTANKAMLAKFGGDLFQRTGDEATLLYEAAIGGGIPLVRTINLGLSANEIHSIRGIINGTSNYILTSMESRGVEFEEALAEAQRLGYAEPDPSFDVNGGDAGHKIVLLASQCFGMDIRFDDIRVEGIESLTPYDFSYAAELKYRIKLLGIAKFDKQAGAAEVRVGPTLIPADSMLASVHGVYNAVEIVGEPIGPTLYYGQGAGPKATASAVVSDLMAVAASTASGAGACESRLAIPKGRKTLKSFEDLVTEYYLRFLVKDRPGTLAQLSKILGDRGISIKSMVQLDENGGDTAHVALITHEAREGEIQSALAEIKQLEANQAEPFVLRVEEEAVD